MNCNPIKRVYAANHVSRYLLLELVEGGELFDYLVKQGKLKEMEALTFFQQIIAGLDYCHKHLICHRDLKPENLLLDTQKKIKIADFGMASLQVTGKMLETSCGSPHYASPEIIRGVKYDGSAADIWSCGVILYALLTGNLPFDDENIRKLLQKVKSGVYVIPDTVPRDAADLIRKMLVLNPAKRITIKEIEQHPWFTKIPYNSKLSGDSPLRSPPSPESIKPLAPEDLPSVDVDIIASLGVLGYGTEEEIIKALISPEPNYEKVFYWVLRQKKTEFLENFDPEQEWTNSEGKSLKRRIGSHGSRTSLLGDRSSIYNSIYMSADTLQKSPPDSPTEDKKTPLPAKKTSISEVPTSDAPKKLSGDAQKRRSYNKSPLSATVSGEEDDNEFKPELVEKAKKAALQALEGQRPPQTDVNIESIFGIGEKSAAKSQGTLFEQFKNSVVIENARNPESDQYQSLPALAPNSKQVDDKRTNDQQAEQAEQYDMGTPKFHRKNLDLSVNISSSNLPLKHASGAMNQSSPSLFAHRSSEASLPSPNIVVTKKSWFANLFSFKPESFSVTTAGSLSDVLSRIQLKLKKENIDFQPSKDGNALKCRYDDFGRSNGVKFRISVIAKENGTVDVTCTQQQGLFTIILFI
jgi:serine/threonine protein kinase